MKSTNFILAILLLLLSSTFSFAASVIPYSSLGQVSELSHNIVLAKAAQTSETQIGTRTYFRTDFEVLSSIKGDIPAESSFYLQASSYREHGYLQPLSGDVQYEDGETYLFFLVKNKNGQYNPILLSYYTFHSMEVEGKQVLVPLKAEVAAFQLPDQNYEALYIYKQEALLRLLTEMQQGTANWDNELTKSEIEQVNIDRRAAPSHCTWLSFSGTSARWQTFDTGGSVDFVTLLDAVNIPACANGASAVSDARSEISSNYSGVSIGGNSTQNITLDLSMSGFDNVENNVSNDEIGIIFNDPVGDVNATFNCTSTGYGGTLGRGGPWTNIPGTHTFNGNTFRAIAKGRVIMNNSNEKDGDSANPINSCLCDNPALYTVFKNAMIHEISHALGIGHHTTSSDLDPGNLCSESGGANMSASGAANINSCDIDCLDFTYVAESPVPIELAYFQGELETDEVNLSWASHTEINNAYFTLEKSNDGTKFEAIAQIDGAGSSVETLEYTFTDDAPFIGTNYYRLGQTDYDGTQEYFDVISIEYQSTSRLVLVPNPMADENSQIQYYNDKESQLDISVFDLSGRKILNQTFRSEKGFNQIPLELPSLNAGIYLVQILDGNQKRHNLKLNVL